MGELNVSVILTAAADQLKKELGQAGNSFTNFSQQAGSRINAVSDQIGSIGKTMSLSVTGPIAAVGAGMLGLAKKAASAGDEIAKASRSIGIDPTALQELRFAVGQVANIGQEGLGTALSTLNKQMGDLASGQASKSLVEAFNKIGVSLEDVQSGSVDVDQVFTKLTTALGETDSAAEAASLASELLGARVGRDLGAQLREGGDQVAALRDRAHELGVVIGKEALGASEKFNDQWSEMNQMFDRALTTIGESLLPILVNDLLPFLIDTAIPGLIKMGQAVGDLIGWFTNLSPEVKTTVGIVAAALGAGGPVLVALSVMGKAFSALLVATGPIGWFILAATTAYTVWQVWGDKITEIVGGVITWFQETFAAFGEWWNGLWDALIGGVTERFKVGWETVTNLTTAAKDSVVGTLTGLWDTLVGNSIIPDMWDAIIAHWTQGGQAIARSTQATANVTAQSFSSMAKQASGDFQAMFQAFGQHSKQMYVMAQAAGTAQSLIATYTGIAEALKLGWPLGPIAAAKIAAIGFAQVAAIGAVAFAGGGGGGKGSAGAIASGGGSANAIVAAGAQPTAAAAQAPADPQRIEATITIRTDRTRFDRSEVEDMFSQISDLIGDGARLNVRFG